MDVVGLVETCLKEHWNTKYKLWVGGTESVGEEEWLVRGKLSRPTLLKPIPEAVVNVVFKVRKDGEVMYRLEAFQHWKDATKHNEVILDRIIKDKGMVSKEHKDIVQDTFGATRKQIGFAKEVNEEQKIAKDKETIWYSDESDDEFFSDAEFVDTESVLDFAKIQEEINECLERVFQAADSFREIAENDDEESQLQEEKEAEHQEHKSEEQDVMMMLTYAESQKLIQEVVTQLELDMDDYVVLLGCLDCTQSEIDLVELKEKLLQMITARLTSPNNRQNQNIWEEAYLDAHSPQLGKSINGIITSIQRKLEENVEDEAESEVGPVLTRAQLRECLHNHGEGLFSKKEVNAVVALQPSVESNPDLILIQVDSLSNDIRNVRLQYARHGYLCYLDAREIEVHLLSILRAQSQRKPDVENEDVEASEEKEENEEKIECLELAPMTRAEFFHRVLVAADDLVLSKYQAIAILSKCQEENIPAEQFIKRCSVALFHQLHPDTVRRASILHHRYYEKAHFLNSEHINQHLDQVDTEDMTPDSFHDMIETLVGETVDKTLTSCLAAVHSHPHETHRVNVHPLRISGVEYISHVIALFGMQERQSSDETKNDQDSI